MATLTLQQYEKLSEQRGAFDDWIRAGGVRNLPIPWCNQMSGIFQQVYKTKPVDYRCKSCLGHALTRLHGLLVEYETEQAILKAELERKEQEELLNSTPKGTKAKNWMKDAST